MALKILCVTITTQYFPLGISGQAKANASIITSLAARGHDCKAVLLLHPDDGARYDASLVELQQAGIAVASEDWCDRFALDGIDVTVGVEVCGFTDLLREEARRFEPDCVLVTAAQQLLYATQAACAAPCAFLVHDFFQLPFGPFASSARLSRSHAKLFDHAAGVISVSQFSVEYLRRFGGVESELLHLPCFGQGPFPDLGAVEAGYVTYVNPSLWKGLPVFLEVARRLPEVAFATIPLWATTPHDRAAVEALPNVTVLEPSRDIDAILAQARVVMIPSMGYDPFSVLAVETMLRGVPVVGCDVGGIPEALLGVGETCPVPALTPTGAEPVSEDMAGAWCDAIRRLLSDRDHYQERARAGRRAAEEYISRFTIEAYERYFESLAARRGAPAPGAPSVPDLPAM
jgi:glycosyltransferase involved in cell wall biosynthesis